MIKIPKEHILIGKQSHFIFKGHLKKPGKMAPPLRYSPGLPPSGNKPNLIPRQEINQPPIPLPLLNPILKVRYIELYHIRWVIIR